jgi:tetratricopeptide (TPR) repeat protein
MENNSIARLLNEIKELINKKQFIVAEKKARTLITTLNINSEFNYMAYINATVFLVESLSRNARNLIAVEILEKAILDFPYEAKFLENLLDLYIKLKRVPKVEQVLKTLVNVKPSDTGLRLKLVNIFIEKNEIMNAIIEIKKIISLGSFDIKIISLLVSLLGKEKLFTEQLKMVKLMQEIEPANSSFQIEEARILIALNKQNEAFDLVDGLINFKIENHLYDTQLPEIFSEFKELYIKTGNQELLYETFSLVLLNNFQNFNKEVKMKFVKFATEMNLDILFNYLLNPRGFTPGEPRPALAIKCENNGSFEIITNCLQVLKNENKNFNGKNFMTKYGIQNRPEPAFELALYSLVENGIGSVNQNQANQF